MYVTNTICEEIETFCYICLESAEEHVSSRDSRVKRDNTDVSKLVEWFTIHNPFSNTKQINV